jgi:predicted DNA-binding transcriptional regulator AlpA
MKKESRDNAQTDFANQPATDMHGGHLIEENKATKPARFLNVDQIAEYLNVPTSWIYGHTRENADEVIPRIKIGKYLRFNPDSHEFEQWLKNSSRN